MFVATVTRRPTCDAAPRGRAGSGGAVRRDRPELAGQSEAVKPAQLAEHLGDPARRDERLLEPRGVALRVVIGGAVARVLVAIEIGLVVDVAEQPPAQRGRDRGL